MGEDITDTAEREVLEETGIRARCAPGAGPWFGGFLGCWTLRAALDSGVGMCADLRAPAVAAIVVGSSAAVMVVLLRWKAVVLASPPRVQVCWPGRDSAGTQLLVWEERPLLCCCAQGGHRSGGEDSAAYVCACVVPAVHGVRAGCVAGTCSDGPLD